MRACHRTPYGCMMVTGSMEKIPFLLDLVVLYTFSAVVVYLFHKLNQSPIVGFLLSGVLVGPYGLGLVSDTETVHVLADIGVMLLLFSLGLEFSLEKLLRMRQLVLGTGLAQVLSTVLIVSVVAIYLGVAVPLGIFLGFLLALSSTAVVVKMLMERGEVDAIHGRVALGLLIFQDLCVVPMIILVPLLAGEAADWIRLSQELVQSVFIVGGVIVSARYLFPFLLHQVVETRSRELFVIVAILAFLGTAWLTSAAGFPLALGSFLAGLILSGSEYSNQVFSDIRPLRDTLNSLFFLSMGMLVNLNFVMDHLGMLLAILMSVIVGKALIVTGAVLVTGLPFRVAVLNGLCLAQIGEFSFVLLEAGRDIGLVPPNFYQIVISTAVASMALTPALFALARRIVARPVISRFSMFSAKRQAIRELDTEEGISKDHVILCGFGASGRNIARVLKANTISYIVLELNAQVVRTAREGGEPIYFGDCADHEILVHAGIGQARAIVFAISDPFSAPRAVQTARNLNREIMILIRTRYIAEIDRLYDLGASEVVSEEFESSIELLTRIMRIYHLPRTLVALEVKSIREGRYGIFREGKATVPRLRLSKDLDIYTEAVKVSRNSRVCKEEIAKSNLREHSGALILGIVREGQTINNPVASEVIRADDLLILSGSKDQLKKAISILRES